MKPVIAITALALLVAGCSEADNPMPPKPCELRKVTGFTWSKRFGWSEGTWTFCVVSEKRLATPFKGEPK